jgi:hypothetical protein
MHFCVFQSAGGFFRKDPALAEGFISANLTPAAASISANTLFITLFHLDEDNTNNIYFVDFNEVWRATNATTATSFAADFTELTGIRTTIGAVNIRSLATSRGAYNAAASKLYFATQNGRIFRVDDPVNVAPATAPVEINSGAGMPVGNIISLSVNPRNSDTLVAVYSNYLVANNPIFNIWWCGNATSGAPTWTNIEGNLSLPSIRSVAVAASATGAEYYVGTSTGLYSTTTVNGGSTVWSKEGSTTIGNAVVDALAYRPADKTLVVGTHGIGMFATNISTLPVNLKKFEGRVQDNANYLYWTVDNEVNNSGYEIQRKYQDETDFNRLGFVQGNANSAVTSNYSYADNSVDLGKSAFYRLKQIDLDGKFNYSPVVTLNRKSPQKFIQYVSASQSTLLIRINGGNSRENLMVRIFDESGKMLKLSRISFQTQRLDISHLPHGTYIFDISHPDGRRFTQKIIH